MTTYIPITGCFTTLEQLERLSHLEYYAAIDADNTWQKELDRLKVERYSTAAHGDDGSELRRLYEAKVAADAARHAASK